MADILIFIDFERGHLYPTLKLADSLRYEGYNVCYAGPIDPNSRDLIRKRGFDYHYIFEDVYPNGYNGEDVLEAHYDSLLSGSLDNLLKHLAPKLVLFSSFMSLEGLIFYYMYDIKLAIYFTFYLLNLEEEERTVEERLLGLSLIRFMKLSGNEPQRLLKLAKAKNQSLASFEDIIAPLSTMPRLMLCPRALKIGRENENENEIYLSLGILESDNSNTFLIEDFPHKTRKIIYVSMGSMVHKYPENVRKAFQTSLKTMRSPEFSDFQMYISLGGSSIDIWNLDEVPENVTIFRWVPQQEVLKKASIVVTHGGLGTIKECIHHNVPMLVIPMGRDQHDNAKRVVHHRLGLDANIDVLNPELLSLKLLQLENDSHITNCLSQMKRLIKEENESKEGLGLVKKYITNA
ncbi:MAG: glycosyltransferase [Bacteroidota bacterium]